MRILSINTLLFILALGLLTGCLFTDDLDSDGLPKETQTGQNTFGMLVDGRTWRTSTINVLTNSVYAFYKPSRQFLYISAIDRSDEEISLFIKGVKTNGTYKISPYDESLFPVCADSTRLEIVDSCDEAFKLVNNSTSLIEISRLDTLERIVSGTFNLDLTNDQGETVIISKGRFDISY